MKGCCFDSNPVYFEYSSGVRRMGAEIWLELEKMKSSENEAKDTFSFENHVSPLGLDTN